ncbi:unnamed protein product [Rotaria socialis]|uniref:Rho-GAP domain-containing protein n=1 Tax=Rotaria socialis TaxID=392032 RepID=A0A821CSM9_9BILA|nr:unnamed protein product [Rotaria socialis]CAF4608924.1 unnamed protein product [Rotaria socialis]
MATPPNEPPSQRSRGHELFGRQAKLHTDYRDQSSGLPISDTHIPLPSLKAAHSIASPPNFTSSSSSNLPHQHSPVLMHLRSTLSSTESFAHSSDNNIQLISINRRPELTYIKDLPLPPEPPAYHRISTKLQETDFPLHDHSRTDESEKIKSEDEKPSHLSHTAAVEKFNNDSPTYDDDNDVIHDDNAHNDDEQEYNSESFDEEENSPNINDRDAKTNIHNYQNDSGIHTISSTGNSDQQHDHDHREEKINENLLHMACSTREAVIEDYDSDFDNSSPEDDEQLTNKDSTNEYEEDERTHLILRQQRVLWSIVQEWSRKEQVYCDELKKMKEQVNQIFIPGNFQSLVQNLFEQHGKVYQEIEDLYDGDREPATLIRYLTHAVETLMGTLPVYDEYIRLNLAPIRKLFEKRINTNALPIEDLLSIPPKQFLQILSQVQDLYQTSQSLQSGDTKNMTQLYFHAEKCKLYGSRQDENINKVILKSEEVAIMSARGHRDRCRLILYPDGIVTCTLKAKLLASPKYTLLWFTPILDLQWTISQSASDDTSDTGDELKTNLKSVYQELEKTPKNNNVLASRLSKNIRKHESEFNLAQSKIQLILSSTSGAFPLATILFSSAYQLQDWVDMIDRTKQELIQRSSAALNQTNNQLRLSDSIIQKRLDLIKPNLSESNSIESSSTTQTISPCKTYSGTLCITIYSMQGPALYNPTRQYQTLPAMSSMQQQQQLQKHFQFYVAVEIDSYNTFNTHAKTRTQKMIQPELVEFKEEVFQIELEYSLALRFLIYRIESSTADGHHNSQPETCIGKFHRDIETALRECQQSPNQVTYFESPSGDLKLKISLNYSRREGTFKRQASKRSLAVFGKSIEKLISTPNGHINGIPRIIVKCIEMVEQDGLVETGIYRVCCVASDLQKLRAQFDRDYRHGEEMLAQKNVHVAANLLKLFFRELPEPLFSSAYYQQFLSAVQLTDIDNQRVILVKTFELLNSDNRKILLYLFDHLIRVSENSRTNMMHLENLAVVFGPTLMRPSKLMIANSASNQPSNASGSVMATDLDQMSSELQGSMYQCQVVLACLKLRQNGMLK